MSKKNENEVKFEILSKLMLMNEGNALKMSEKDRGFYLWEYTKKLGLKPESQPLMWHISHKKIKNNRGGEEYQEIVKIYATANASKQFIEKYKISTKRSDRWEDDQNYYVEVIAERDGQSVVNAGFCPKKGFLSSGNAQIGAYTKATRRAVLSISGTGLLDESEIYTMEADEQSSNLTISHRPRVKDIEKDNNITAFLNNIEEEKKVDAITDNAMDLIGNFCDCTDDDFSDFKLG